jgi:beta-lactamase class A
MHPSDPTIRQVYDFIRRHLGRILLILLIFVLLITIIWQFLYPTDKLVPFSSVNGVNLSELSKTDAITKLDKLYTDKTISIHLGDSKKAFSKLKISELGVNINNASRINSIDYPWYLRIIPSSILWAHLIINPSPEPTYQVSESKVIAYINKELGATCEVKPQDAGLKLTGSTFQLTPSHNGGFCEYETVKNLLLNIKPNLGENKIIIPFEETAVTIDDSSAEKLASDLEKRAGVGVELALGEIKQTIPTNELFSWIDFDFKDGKLIYNFNVDRASVYLNKEIAPKVAVNAGTTVINTRDFTVVTRIEGVVGKKLDINATLANLKLFLDGGSNNTAIATTDIQPNISYTRSYSPTDVGISAFMEQYSQSHYGTFGMSLVELSGKYRRGSYNSTKIFTPASTYKLFVAYSALLKVESGAWHMTDPIVDIRNLDECFDDMLVQSRNTCAEALILKLGREQITNDAIALGCTQTSFVKNGNLETSPADLALYMAQLATGQLLSQQSSRDKIIDSLKRSTFRSGIPAGITNSTVINKIGVLWGLLNDAAIVYSPTGTYILVIMTDGTSWPVIADLAGKIEALRSQ